MNELMEFDAPATIAILGAGPIGIEAALYARYLGYQVLLLERADEIASRVRERGDAPLEAPLADLSSSLGLAAIQAQNPDAALPALTTIFSANEWVAQYLEPLSKTDLMRGGLQLQSEVVSIARSPASSEDLPDDDGPEIPPFELALRTSGDAPPLEADIVIDASGVDYAASDADFSRFEGLDLSRTELDEATRRIADFYRPRDGSDDTLPTPAAGAETLMLPERDLYLLGEASFGGNQGFTFAAGLRQIRDLFAGIGGRATLDLYATARSNR